MKPNYLYGSWSWTPSSRKISQWQLDSFQAFPFIGINIITLPIQKYIMWYGWFTTEEKSCTNDSITFINVDNNYCVYRSQCRWKYWYTYHWKHPLKLLYPYIIWSVKAIHIVILDTKFNWFRGKNLDRNMKTICLLLLRGYKYIYIYIIERGSVESLTDWVNGWRTDKFSLIWGK